MFIWYFTFDIFPCCSAPISPMAGAISVVSWFPDSRTAGVKKNRVGIKERDGGGGDGTGHGDGDMAFSQTKN